MMKTKTALRKLLFGLFLCPILLFAQPVFGQDTCTINSECLNATDFGFPNTNSSTLNYWGCNLYSSPDTLIQGCLMGDFPTVWYRFTTDWDAENLTVVVWSDDFEMPVISLFKSPSGGCGDLEQVLLTNSNLTCVIGSDGLAKVIGTTIDTNTTYYLAVSSYLSIGGDFNLHLRVLSDGSICVTDRALEITARENGGPLEGPFDPNEKVSICMHVLDYTAADNGCQWFQGLIPVFGNGWDPSSFDAMGQPLNATVNGSPMGEPGNGVYGAAHWDWFSDVDYHHYNNDLSIGDFDNNGRIDMCNSRYDPDCPLIGVNGGCCNPCWGTPSGDLLPPGWFAYGINGSCPDPGPPIRVDWGDGNTCGGGMGSWQFCFDLVTRDIPDCSEDSTKRDLSLGFFTFADGEIGAWTGNGSVCIKDAPLSLSLEAKCGRVTTLDPEILPVLESGDTLFYQIQEPDVMHWEWNISPHWAVPYLQNTGVNGFTIAAPLINETGETVDITGIFIGHYGPNFVGSNDFLVKKIKFKLQGEVISAVSPIEPGENSTNKIKVYPLPTVDAAVLEWSFELKETATINIFDAQGHRVFQKEVGPGTGNTKQINTIDLSSGIYYVQFGNADFQYVTKMVKF
jgi:hypothetical protein